MFIHEIVKTLVSWTPYLAVGFLWNIVIAMSAMILGTTIGGGLAYLRASSRRRPVRFAEILTELMRDTPTVVCQFYLIFMLPVEVTLPWSNLVVPFPSWIKASLALAVAVSGYVSDNLGRALKQAAAGNRFGLTLLIPSWSSYFVVIVIASSSASVIGVDEMVSRCNAMVNAVGNTQMMIWAYLYAMLWFFVFCFISSKVIHVLARRVEWYNPPSVAP